MTDDEIKQLIKEARAEEQRGTMNCCYRPEIGDMVGRHVNLFEQLCNALEEGCGFASTSTWKPVTDTLKSALMTSPSSIQKQP